MALSQTIFSVPLAANSPAITKRESPGRKKPSMIPVSQKTIAARTEYPPQRISPSRSLNALKSSFSQSNKMPLTFQALAHLLTGRQGPVEDFSRVQHLKVEPGLAGSGADLQHA